MKCLKGMLHNKRKMWYSMALVGNFETEIDEGNTEMRITNTHEVGGRITLCKIDILLKDRHREKDIA